jgi:hypothetical protein
MNAKFYENMPGGSKIGGGGCRPTDGCIE